MAEGLERLAGSVLAAGAVGDVAGKAEMLGAEVRRGVLRGRLVEVEDGDPCAMLGEQPGRREPDAPRAGRAGDDGCLAGQKHPFPP